MSAPDFTKMKPEELVAWYHTQITNANEVAQKEHPDDLKVDLEQSAKILLKAYENTLNREVPYPGTPESHAATMEEVHSDVRKAIHGTYQADLAEMKASAKLKLKSDQAIGSRADDHLKPSMGR